jgi:glycosyltransferase involved in cell wall biosynthesis
VIAQLHVAAMPFPSRQGTQAAVAAMMGALVRAGRPAKLLTYAHGEPGEAPAFEHLRLRRSFGDRSLRSGPSLAKVAQDLALARELRRLRPVAAVAHHVEAATACALAGVPAVFVAHGALGPELPSYFESRAMRRAARRAGDGLDRFLARGADSVLAVSPLLARRIEDGSGVPARWLPIPWPVAAPIERAERESARRELGVSGPTVLYAGNLDRYQGFDVLLEAMGRVPAATLVVASSSAEAASLPSERVIVVPLGGEAERRRIHAAADVVAIPRAAAGGLPVKLIDAMARGVPVVAAKRATAGLALEGVASIARDDDPSALATAIAEALRAPPRERAARAREWVRQELSDAAFLAALDAATAGP